jgi:hypothetical protein
MSIYNLVTGKHKAAQHFSTQCQAYLSLKIGDLYLVKITTLKMIRSFKSPPQHQRSIVQLDLDKNPTFLYMF